MNRVRQLRAIQIDDDEHNRLDNQGIDLSPFVSIDTISTEVGAQRLMAEARATGAGLPAIDIILADVDFSKAPVPRGLDWGTGSDSGQGLRPFGPLLLLPFLASRSISVFVPYSSYWLTPEVLQNGYVAVALSLILSVVEGKLFTIQTAIERVSELGRVKPPSGETVKDGRVPSGGNREHESMLNEDRDALVKGLRAFRLRLLNRPLPAFVDIQRTRERLEAVEQRACETGDWPLSIPLTDDDGPISLAFMEASHGSMVEVEVAPFFADLLGFQPPRDGTCLSELYTELDSCGKKSISVQGGVHDSYTYACKALSLCEMNFNLKDAVERMSSDAPKLDWEFVRRLAVEFAWVSAWSHGKQRDKSYVHGLLGFKVKRSNGDVAMHPQVTNLYRRLISVNDKKAHLPGSSPRRPFKTGERKTAYNLDEDAEADLSEIERLLCRQYAEECLKWFEYRSGKIYPTWMKARDHLDVAVDQTST